MLAGETIGVEVDTARGLNAFSVVGLPDKAVEEARDRVGSALKNSGFDSPKHSQTKTIVSLTPAETKKEGAFFDLAIAVGFLLATEQVVFNSDDKIFIGELSLAGELKKVRGTLPIVQKARHENFTEIFVPEQNALEAALVSGITVYPVKNINQLVLHLNGTQLITPQPETTFENITKPNTFDLSDIRGQESAKRGLEIAAAGGHNICMYGPPGTGKTMLARAFASLLPQLNLDEALEVTGIHSILNSNVSSDTIESFLISKPPFRSPHHTASYVALIGGGANVKPGEATLAHRGVLFLDEFPEFDRKVIEALRQPLEDNYVSISRAKGSAQFPSNFILVAAMNPCPCGNKGSKKKQCRCSGIDIARYEKKISGPIMDRIDLWVSVAEIDYASLGKTRGGENSNDISLRIKNARDIQQARFNESKKNADMSVRDLEKYAYIKPEIRKILDTSAERLQLSPRAYHRVIKLARTIADLENEQDILENHILEALQYRPKVVY
jgi:magnesium chelatase family protein